MTTMSYRQTELGKFLSIQEDSNPMGIIPWVIIHILENIYIINN